MWKSPQRDLNATVGTRHQIIRSYIMSKEQRNSRENKKKAAMTPKEKKAAKKSKKESKDFIE
jgi:hypothetical protein